MFDFSKAESPQQINKEFILQRINDVEIFYYYFGDFKIGKIYSSVFRKDKSPSTGFYISESGKLIYNDISTREGLDCFAFVQKLYNCSFNDAVKRIANDFNLTTNKVSTKATKAIEFNKTFDRTEKPPPKIQFTAQTWGVDNLEFWKQYHLGKDDVIDLEVYSIDKLWINEIFIPNPNNYQRYALTLMDGDEMLTKVYTPEDKDHKWVSNIPLDMPFGLKNLKHKEDKSFGAKSVKCMGVMKKFLPETYSTQNENRASFTEEFIDSLQFNYDKNYLGGDNDKTGKEWMKDMEEDFFIPCPVPYKRIKDWSDWAKSLKSLIEIEKYLKQQHII